MIGFTAELTREPRETIRLGDMSINGVEFPIKNASDLEAIIRRCREADAEEILQRLRDALDAATFQRALRALK